MSTDLPPNCLRSHAGTSPTTSRCRTSKPCCATSTASSGWPTTRSPGRSRRSPPCRRAGRRVLFVTNNSSATIATQERALADVGIEATGDVVSSAMAAALLLEPGQRALVAGGPGVVEALEARGVTAIVNDGELDASTPVRSTPSSPACTETSTIDGSRLLLVHSTAVPGSSAPTPTRRTRRRPGSIRVVARSSPRSPRPEASCPTWPASRTRRWRG